jgi:hypothetical protein
MAPNAAFVIPNFTRVARRIENHAFFTGKYSPLHWFFSQDEQDVFLKTLIPTLQHEKPLDYLAGLKEEENKGLRKFGLSIFGRLVHPLPAGFRQRLGNTLSLLNRIPVSNWVKFDLLFGAIGGICGGMKDTIQGFCSTTESLWDKTVGGMQAGFKSALKSTADFGVIAASASLLPRLLCLTPLGTAGIVVGLIGSTIASSVTRKLTDWFMPTQAVPSIIEDEPGGLRDSLRRSPNPIIQAIGEMAPRR